MNFANPTKIRIGMTAAFLGHTYRVIGRSVLGETEASGTYYWNEFNLESPGGKYATLVFEESGSRGNWKLFEMFEPRAPMTAKEAAEISQNGQVNLDGTPLTVTLVDRSRVYFVEGKTPEGVLVGQKADYFNAEAGDKMIVVSWTGDEVEYYSGRTISVAAVASAFSLSAPGRLAFALSGGRGFLNSRILIRAALLAMFAVVFIAIFSAVHSPARPPGTIVIQAGPPTLAVGQSGVLEGRYYHIDSQALVEVAEFGLRFSRHEYELTDDDRHTSLLLSGAGTGAATWLLCAPIDTPPPLTPQEAGSLSAGQIIQLDGDSVRISKLFRSTIREADGASPQARQSGDVFYGLSGTMSNNTLIVQWNATNILWLKGTPLPERAVKAAFATAAGR
jgi:hypothetical protein